MDEANFTVDLYESFVNLWKHVEWWSKAEKKFLKVQRFIIHLLYQWHLSLYSSHCENKTYTILYYIMCIETHKNPFPTLLFYRHSKGNFESKYLIVVGWEKLEEMTWDAWYGNEWVWAFEKEKYCWDKEVHEWIWPLWQLM